MAKRRDDALFDKSPEWRANALVQMAAEYGDLCCLRQGEGLILWEGQSGEDLLPLFPTEDMAALYTEYEHHGAEVDCYDLKEFETEIFPKLETGGRIAAFPSPRGAVLTPTPAEFIEAVREATAELPR